MKKKYWWIVDNALSLHGEIYETKLDCARQSEAIKKAKKEWGLLSEHDKRGRDAFYIGYAATDEDGCIDYNSMTKIVEVKC